MMSKDEIAAKADDLGPLFRLVTPALVVLLIALVAWIGTEMIQSQRDLVLSQEKMTGRFELLAYRLDQAEPVLAVVNENKAKLGRNELTLVGLNRRVTNLEEAVTNEKR